MTCNECTPRHGYCNAVDEQYSYVELCPRHASLEERLKELERQLPCAGCGMVYPGKPSAEPWSCDKCLTESDVELSEVNLKLSTQVRDLEQKEAALRHHIEVEVKAEVDRLTVELREAASLIRRLCTSVRLKSDKPLAEEWLTRYGRNTAKVSERQHTEE